MYTLLSVLCLCGLFIHLKIFRILKYENHVVLTVDFSRCLAGPNMWDGHCKNLFHGGQSDFDIRTVSYGF